MKRQASIWFLAIIGLGIIFLIFSSTASGLIEKWLWMREVGYAQVFWRILSIKWALFGIAFGFVLLCFWINLRLVARTVPTESTRMEDRGLPGGLTSFRSLLVGVVPAVIFALVFVGAAYSVKQIPSFILMWASTSFASLFTSLSRTGAPL